MPEAIPTAILETVLERMLADLTAEDDGAELERARALFHADTGAFEPGDACYEERIQFFFDWFLCEHRTADGEAPAARWLRRGAGDERDREVAQALLTSARSLYEAREGGLLVDRIGGARYRLEPSATRPGDRFDGRVLVLGDALALAPGMVFHPPQAHDALDELLLEVGAPGDLDRLPLLDGLLRVRMRLDRFTSIRPRHLYRVEALEDRDILSAGWARKDQP